MPPSHGLSDPFAAYNAGSNIEAHLVCGLLREAGIQSVVIEDVSQVGVWLGGHVAEIHKPQVWIERADLERARPVLTEYDRRNAERRDAEQNLRTSEPPIEVVCEECGKHSVFPAIQQGTTQNCTHCRAYLDVGDEATIAGWEEDAEEEPAGAVEEPQSRKELWGDQPREPQPKDILTPDEYWSYRNGHMLSALLAICGGLVLMTGFAAKFFSDVKPLTSPSDLTAICLLTGIPGVIGSVASLAGSRRWSRLGYVLAVPLLLALPFGTILGFLWLANRPRYLAACKRVDEARAMALYAPTPKMEEQ